MRATLARLKKRRDELLNRACNRQERPDIMEQVRALNREIEQLEHKDRKQEKR